MIAILKKGTMMMFTRIPVHEMNPKRYMMMGMVNTATMIGMVMRCAHCGNAAPFWIVPIIPRTAANVSKKLAE
jgi:predicted membrane channel-forming protein YqfA (hemolysin III family)